jgi:hypothetical protein
MTVRELLTSLVTQGASMDDEVVIIDAERTTRGIDTVTTWEPKPEDGINAQGLVQIEVFVGG